MSLVGSHVVIVSGNPADCSSISDLILQADGLPHVAENRTQALGMLLELYHLKIIPRAVVTAWNLCSPESGDRRFYEMLNMPEETTAYALVKHARRMDQHLAILVLENGPIEIRPGAANEYGFGILQWPFQCSCLVMRLLEDPRMADMKAAAYERWQTSGLGSAQDTADDSGKIQIAPKAGSRA